MTLYRYIDKADNEIKYIGIVYSKSRNIRQRVLEHLADEWAKNKEWIIEVYEDEIKTRTDAEFLEAHCIALYKTYNFFNDSKCDWGISQFIQINEELWKPLKSWVQNPNVRAFTKRHQEERIGEEHIQLKGELCRIIKYNNSDDIDVRFKDGTIVEHRRYVDFKKGKIANPNYFVNKYVGQTKIMHCGMKCSIIAYRKQNDIDVQFENGEILSHRNYNQFKKQAILCPSLRKFEARPTDRLGEHKKMNNGQICKIIKYVNSNDITVQFEDGYITHSNYANFKKGVIQNKSANKEQKVGLRKRMNNGLWATIKRYNGCYDIDIEFEDGYILKHATFQRFKEGTASNPNIKNRRTGRRIHAERIGETRKMKNGEIATIIEYRTSQSIDIQFEDGNIVCNRQYGAFVRGLIRNVA